MHDKKKWVYDLEIYYSSCSFSSSFKCGSCYSIVSFMCKLCISLFVFLYFFCWPLCCLFFFDLRILIASLVSSNCFLRENRRCNHKWTTQKNWQHEIRYTRRGQTKQKHNTIYVGHRYAHTNTNNVNKTWALLQTTVSRVFS